MQPVSPIIPGVELQETVYAANQPPYRPLPVFKGDDGTVLSRWHLGFWERVRVLFNGDVYLWMSTFNQPLQPVKMQVEAPDVE